MISTGEIVLERIEYALGEREVDNEGRLSQAAIEATGFKKRYEAAPGTGVFELAMSAAAKIPADAIAGTGGVVAATFSYADRFPSLAVRIGSALGMDPSAPMLDLQMACSAYPYALYVAGCLCAATGKKILVVDGDVQTPLARPGEGTLELFSDAATATVVSVRSGGRSHFAFLSKYGRELSCPSAGPLSMDGFGVFSFVAAEVAPFLSRFAAEAGEIDRFVPHQANMYMVRRLAEDAGLADKILSSEGRFANPGSASIPLTIAASGEKGRFLLAGFGAGLSAAAAAVTVS